MKAEYITHSGDDLLVVNAARVSFAKEATQLGEGDEKLIKYLAAHQHWTPFAHPQITLRVQAPVFVRTQCFKHKVGFVENEVSRRYVSDSPVFFLPNEWRSAPEGNKKQGSGDKVLPFPERIDEAVQDIYEAAGGIYAWLLQLGVAPEQARMVLPQGMYTEWYWTGSLYAYAGMYKLRTDSHAQSEIQELAHMIGDIIEPLYPVCWKELVTRR